MKKTLESVKACVVVVVYEMTARESRGYVANDCERDLGSRQTRTRRQLKRVGVVQSARSAYLMMACGRKVYTTLDVPCVNLF